jgi:hypothetical protein
LSRRFRAKTVAGDQAAKKRGNEAWEAKAWQSNYGHRLASAKLDECRLANWQDANGTARADQLTPEGGL